MGQKVHPTGFRLGIVKDHNSVWYADGPAYAEKLHIDLKVREYIREKLVQASVSRIEIQRPAQSHAFSKSHSQYLFCFKWF